MPDPFSDAIADLLKDCPGVIGAAFTDLQGQDIALLPKSEKETLRLCAAYGGIAMRRVSTAETEAGQIDHFVLQGDKGSVVTVRVADEYQLIVSVGPTTPSAHVVSAAHKAAQIIEANI